jgi:hypothetical protein
MKANKSLLVLFGVSVLLLSGIWIETRPLAAAEASKESNPAAASRPSKREMAVPKRQVKITWAGNGGDAEVEVKEVVSLGGVEFWRIKSEDNQMELINPSQIQSLSW